MNSLKQFFVVVFFYIRIMNLNSIFITQGSLEINNVGVFFAY